MGFQTNKSEVTSLLEIFQLHTRLLINVLDKVNDGHAQTQILPNTNHLAWLTGHVVSSRYAVCNLLDGNIEEPYPELFSKGKGIEKITYPSLSELTETLTYISNILQELLSNLPYEKLQELGKFKMPLGNGSLRSQIVFFAHHEAYHIGQMGMIRKCLGLNAMRYN